MFATATVPDGESEYEVRMTLNIKASGGTFIAYLRASSDAIYGPNPAGTLRRRTELASSAEPCKDGMTWRIERTAGYILINSDLGSFLMVGDTTIATGKPGYGARDLNTAAGNGFASVSIGPADHTPPVPVSVQSVASSVSANQIDLQWQGVDDGLLTAGDHNGSGIMLYGIYRLAEKDGQTVAVWIGDTPVPTFSDTTIPDPGDPQHPTKPIPPNSTFTYFIVGVDHFYQYSLSQTFTVHTPAAGGIDPRRTGVRANGAYWGGNGEQIDLLSGNLNFTLPLLRAQGRGGWGVTFALNYNSANFRKDTAATWKMGRDSGYGFGWKFLAGSLTAYYTDWWAVHHYVFTDSTGAEYRLNNQSNGIWYSQEAIYVRYDPARNQLYFPDGSFWEFGAVSSGIEEDAGTMYPTKMQDTNGNFIAIVYQTGIYAMEPQSSSRIATIEDARAQYDSLYSSWWYYKFTYNYNPATDTMPHLAGIVNYGGTEAYSFSIVNTNLYSPFNGESSLSFGPTTQLLSVTQVGANLTHSMTYNNNSCELTKVAFPYGASLGWEFRDFTFSDSRVIRDMLTRTLNDGVNGDKAYTFWHDQTHDYNTSNHYMTVVDDPSRASTKQWVFDNATGLQVGLWEIGYGTGSPPPFFILRATNLYWTNDSEGNPYIGTSYSTNDPNLGTQQIARTDQIRDNFGNLLQMKVYDYNSATPARTYNNTYYRPGNYINNRLASSTVTPAVGATIPLVTNTYDQSQAWNSYSACGTWSFPAGTPSTAREFDPAYNGNGNIRGNLSTTVSPGSTRCMGYDLAGIVMQTKDDLGHAVTTTLDSNHNYAVPAAITTGNLTTTMTWNGAFQPTGTTNPNGALSGLAYDGNARPANSTSPYGATTTITYTNPSENTLATTTTTTNGRWSKTTMDGFGRAVKVETGYGTNPGTTLSMTETQYAPCGCTPMGKVKQVSVPRAPNTTAYWTWYEYDALGRTIKVHQPNNAGVTQYDYAGNTVKVTDPAGAWKLFTTDAVGNLRQVTEPNPAGGTFVTNYTYSALNQLLTVSMGRPSVPGGSTVTQTRTFVYNNDQRLQSVTNPENGTTTYTYKVDGSMATKTDAKGQVLTYWYDTLGRLTQVKNGNTILRTLAYDANGYGTYLAGRLARVDYGSGINGTLGNAWTELYSYDAPGGILKKKLVWSRTSYQPASLEARWTYDDEGKMTSVKYPDYFGGTGPTYTYTFDSMARPLSLSDGTNTIASGATYGPAGEMTALQYMGIGESRTYNEQKQLTSISTNGGWISYNYSATNNNGRITGSTTITGESVTYTYDSLNRLISATSAGQWGLDFSYDGFGNRLGQNVQPGQWQGYVPTIQQSYDMTTNRLVGQGSDANGNMTSLGTYDVENRLAASNNDTYDYAPDNKRIYKSTQGTNPIEEVYFYAGGRKIATYKVEYGYPDQNGNLEVVFTQPANNLYFGGKLIASNGQGVVLDRLGSVVARNTGIGTFEKHSYFPYGEERTANGQPTANNRDKFGTYFRDASTGLDYADQRYYGSNSARFLTPDPSEPGDPSDPQTWNLYSYVLGDPVNLNDPEGLEVNVPITDVDRPTCLTRVFKDVITPSGFGTTNDDRAATNFFSSLEGTFGLSLFFETRPSGYTTAKDSPIYQAALGVGFVYINRYAAQWGAESGFHTLKKVIMDASTPIWNRGAGDSRMMRDEFRDKLRDILNGSPNDNKGNCDGLIWSLHLGQSMVATSVGIGHLLSHQLYVYNPVGDALAFHSYNNNNVPKGWSKRLKYMKSIWVPQYGGDYSRFNFFYIPGVELPTH